MRVMAEPDSDAQAPSWTVMQLGRRLTIRNPFVQEAGCLALQLHS